ncbi:TIGR02186 family protein [Desulfotomaculum copahuensis]|uniref:Transmembrane protein n=1 Tax=Desulfotomaculum copahuensis TaxID=1838280 RepID=A0A1B7LI29_9FIRM|nr:TIGR02186 family protein [Desulfotomaculum copahuensis]OAT85844.1 hypothetical protein A6M21_05035 [Desulfotomaculum copahuensis]
MKPLKAVCLVVMTFFLVLTGAPLAMADPVTVITQPDTVEVGVNFSGSQLKVSGQVPPGCQVLLKMESPDRPVGLSKKGKKGGLFYMTVATVNVKGMPGMYKIMSSDKISALPAGLQSRLGLDPDFKALSSKAQVIQKHEEQSIILPPAQAQEYLDGLVRLNKSRGLYSLADYGVKVDGGQYQAVMDVPADVPRGSTKITAYAVKDGRIAASAVTELPVVNIGLVRTLGNMAQTNAVAYGVLCIAVALAAGIIIASLFKLINKYVFRDEGVSAHH